ncbi:hypothetical protein GF323_00680 [Candidatus Woesearchaeota archaeon]|nr:hypothetical protein [Candidatus Woesearchaeota archaeon]
MKTNSSYEEEGDILAEEKEQEKHSEKDKHAGHEEGAKEKKDDDEISFSWVAVAVIAVFIIGIVIYSFQGNDQQQEQQEISDEGNELQDNVLAVVNGQEIYQNQVDSVKSAIQQRGGQPKTDEEVLQQLISTTLLLQYADRLNITVPDAAVGTKLDYDLRKQGTSLSDVQQQLSAENFNSLVSQYRQQLTLETLARSLVNISVPDEQAMDFFEENKANLVENQSVRYEDVEPNLKDFMESMIIDNMLNDIANQLRNQSDIRYS